MYIFQHFNVLWFPIVCCFRSQCPQRCCVGCLCNHMLIDVVVILMSFWFDFGFRLLFRTHTHAYNHVNCAVSVLSECRCILSIYEYFIYIFYYISIYKCLLSRSWSTHFLLGRQCVRVGRVRAWAAKTVNGNPNEAKAKERRRRFSFAEKRVLFSFFMIVRYDLVQQKKTNKKSYMA